MNSIEDKTGIPYIWLDEDEWAKLQFRLRSQLGAILNPLRKYGQSDLVEGAIGEILGLFDLASQYVRGKDIPITLRDKPAKHPSLDIDEED